MVNHGLTEREVAEFVRSAVASEPTCCCAADDLMPDMSVTSVEVGLSGADLYRVLMLVEERFATRFTPAYIGEHGFRTIREIVETTLHRMEESERKDCHEED